jgi:putative endonuclease
MFWVYILENPHGKLYVGQTKDIVERLADHNRTDSFEGHFTRKNGPWKLVWSEEHPARSSAMLREQQIKRMKSANWIRTHLLTGGPNGCYTVADQCAKPSTYTGQHLNYKK